MTRIALSTIEATDEEIASAIADASGPALMMSMIQMTGDTALLDGPLRPHRPAMLEVQGGLDEDERAAIRRQALGVIREYRDKGCPTPPPLEEPVVARMMAFIVGEDAIPGDYRTMMLEELDLEGEDPRRLEIDPAALERHGADCRVVIVGAGMSGLLLGARLRQAGVPFKILEKNRGVGGTWFENRYPGCRVDIASHSYSYSFEPGHDWQHFFGEHDEVRDYFASFAEKYGLLPHIEFDSVVSSARYDEPAQRWRIEATRAGETRTLDARILVSAVGQLNRPKIPDVEGRERFTGPQMHTAEWNADVDLAGKRIAVVGSGASAFQLVPELAQTAASVCVFQRTAPWMFPNPGYHATVSEGQRWCFEHLPGYERWFRFLELWPMTDKAHPQLLMDPEWQDEGRSCGVENKAMRDSLVAYIRSQVKDPDLLEKVIPAYPPFGTRVLQDNGSWLAALQRDHVELIAEGIEKVTPSSVITSSGEEREVDVIVWATGFHADRFLWPMEIVGPGNKRISEDWRDAPQAYLGIVTPGYPNLFCLYGPNTNVAHTANVIFVSECQARYIGSAIKRMIEQGLGALECRAEVTAEYESRLSKALSQMVWSHPDVHSFYRGASGRVVVNMPWKIIDYWRWTREIDPGDYETRPTT